MRIEEKNNLSRKLSYLLRHDRAYDFLPGGWRAIDNVMSMLSLSLDEVRNLVAEDDKGRFELDEARGLIRALYGHSVNVDLMLTNDAPPSTLYHGTAEKYIPSIRENGILSKSRQFVHLTDNIETAISTGSRHGKPAILEISADKMAANGFIFHKLHNDIWLTKVIPAEYINF